MSQSNSIRYRRSPGVEIEEIHRNVGQELIEITEDKLKLLLAEHLSSIESRNTWHTPLALLITIVLVLTTTQFKESLGLSADTWAAIFIMSAGLCVFWLGRTLWERPKKSTAQELIDKIKNKQSA